MNRFAYSSVEHFCVVLNTIGRQIVGMVVAIPVVSAATRGRRSSPSSIRIGARLDERLSMSAAKPSQPRSRTSLKTIPDGIQPADPMIDARGAAYPVSFGRRQ